MDATACSATVRNQTGRDEARVGLTEGFIKQVIVAKMSTQPIRTFLKVVHRCIVRTMTALPSSTTINNMAKTIIRTIKSLVTELTLDRVTKLRLSKVQPVVKLLSTHIVEVSDGLLSPKTASMVSSTTLGRASLTTDVVARRLCQPLAQLFSS